MLTETLSNHPAALVEETSTALDEQQRHVAWHEHHVIELRKQRRAARSWWQILQWLKDRREVETLRANGPQVDPGLRSELARRQAGMAAEDRAAYELSVLSVLSNDWRLFRGYANRRGEVDLLLVGPQGIWAVEVKGRAVVVSTLTATDGRLRSLTGTATRSGRECFRTSGDEAGASKSTTLAGNWRSFSVRVGSGCR